MTSKHRSEENPRSNLLVLGMGCLWLTASCGPNQEDIAANRVAAEQDFSQLASAIPGFNPASPTSGKKWTLPVGISASKTSIFGGRPWKLGLQFWYYVESLDNFGADYQVRFGVSPVVKLPW